MPNKEQNKIATDPVTGLIWDIKKYAIHDGPGIRTLVFLKGCPLRCLWCCNPESQDLRPEIIWLAENCIRCNRCLDMCPSHAISEGAGQKKRIDRNLCDFCGICVNRCPNQALNLVGKRMTVDEVLKEVVEDSIFYTRSGGGLTLTGGEPTAQPDFAYELLRQYKVRERGRHTALETCGFVDWPTLSHLLEYTDLVLYDIKHMDSGCHFRLTGVSNELILQNARRIAKSCSHLVIRLPLIPGINDTEENIRRTASFALKLPGVEEIDLLPYHRLGEPKYGRLGREYPFVGTIALSPSRLAEIRSLVESYGLRVNVGG
ncbi:MAG: glycyl-radical enzyme activating protein [Thermodesulfobacteriota bacterium]